MENLKSIGICYVALIMMLSMVHGAPQGQEGPLVSDSEIAKINKGVDQVLEGIKSGQLEQDIRNVFKGTELEATLNDQKKVDTAKDVFSSIFSGTSETEVRDTVKSLLSAVNAGDRYGRKRTRPVLFGSSTTTTTASSSSTPSSTPEPETSSPDS